MKNDAISCDVSRSPSTSASTRLVVRSSWGLDPAILGHGAGVGADVHRNLHEFLEIQRQVGVAETEDHVGPVEDPLVVFLGDPHHVADHLQRQRPGQFADHIGLPVGMIGDHPRDQPVRTLTHRLFNAGHHFRSERPADDRTQPLMPRIVEHDHRTEVLGQLRGLVVDRDAAGGAENVRMAAGEVDVVQLGQRPIPVAGLKALVSRLGAKTRSAPRGARWRKWRHERHRCGPRSRAIRDGCRQAESPAAASR